MNIEKQIEETEKFECEYNGQIVHFTARKAAITPRFVKNIDTVTNFPRAIISIVTDWDVFWDAAETQKVELVEDQLERIPRDFFDAIIDTVCAAWNGDKKKIESLKFWLIGEGGESSEEWFVKEAAKVLGCSFIELWDHPQRHDLMAKAFTIEAALTQAKQVWEAQAKQKEELEKKAAKG